MAEILSSPFAMSASTRRLKSVRASATAVFNTICALAQLADEPTARNSKRLPVKAKGEVLLRSVLSRMMSGICGISICTPSLPLIKSASLSAFSICSITSDTVLPRKLDMIAGGASFAPRRWPLPASMIDAFRSPLWRYTPISVSTTNTTKRRLSSGVFPGPCKRMPVSVDSDQLLCLPEPFTPLNGFSCSNTSKPCLCATFFMSDINSMLWSTAKLVSSKMGAHSN